MAAQTKNDLVEELSSGSTKADLVEVLGRKLKKDEIASLLEDESGATKDELVHKLGSRTKDELTDWVSRHLTKDDLQRLVDEKSQDDEDSRDRDSDSDRERGSDSDSGARGQRRQPERDESTDIDWSAELEWSPPPQPTPAPVTFRGAAPFMPGQRVRVDLAGLPMLGVFAGKGASAAGTITGVDAQAREVRVYLDASFDGQKELLLPPERITPDG